MSDRSIHANLTTEAHEGFHAFCDDSGVSISGLLEVIGLRLGDRSEGEPDAARLSVGHLRTSEVILAARKVDAGRRRRGR